MSRTTRKDHDQESLVSKKDEINQRTSKIIELLIETKKSWNGKPAPGIGVSENHSLKEPLPPQTISTMDQVVQMVQEVDSKLKDIDKQQSGYQSSLQEKEHTDSKSGLDLSALGSNIGTRFISHIKAPFQFGDTDKWVRLKLLRSSSKMEKHIEDIQSYILSSDSTSIPNVIYKAKDMFHIFDNEIVEPIISSMRDLPEKRTIAPEDIESNIESEESQDIPLGYEEYNKYQPQDIIGGSKAMRDQIKNVRDGVPSELFKPYLEEYNNILRKITYILSILNNNYNEAEKEYKSLIIDIDDFNNKISEQVEFIQKDASGPISNWLKRKNVELFHSRYDHLRGLRIRADDIAGVTKSNLNKFMNALEKPNAKPLSLTLYLKSFSSSLAELYRVLYKLGDVHNSRAKVKNYKLKGGNKWPTISEMDLRSLHRALREIESIVAKLNSLLNL